MTTCNGRRGLAWAASVALVSFASSASAQSADQAAARALFNEARNLTREGHYAEACPKLEAAARLYRGSGVLLNLGDCFEHIGRTASAWNEFGEAASLAARAGRPDDEAEARRRQAALEPRLSRLTVRVVAAPSGLALTFDGKELLQAAWGTPIPVDPGTHSLEASAPGRVTWSTSVTVAVETPVEAVVPGLDAVPPAAAVEGAVAGPLPARSSPPAYWTTRRRTSAALSGAGAFVLVAGGVLALVADANYNHAKDESGSARANDSAGAVVTGNVATVVGGIGLAALAVGAIVWFTAPGASKNLAATPGGFGGTF